MSGGVDSSVAALLLLDQGYEVHGVFMKNWADSYTAGYCTAAEDLEDAQAVCDTLNIPLHKVNFTAQYREQVFNHFLQEYQRGRTPNPDVLCNKEIKFKVFLKHARLLGANFMATGHYARRVHDGTCWHLLKGLDKGKDQSYFLYLLEQRQLESVLFPIGELTKPQVRDIAAAAGLVTHAKKSSTGICFIGERKFRPFLNRYLPAQPGEMHTLDGKVVGHHRGLMFYTLGQRQGLGIGGRSGGIDQPWYVVGKDLDQNALIVTQGRDHPSLFHRRLRASQLHWISGPAPALPLSCRAKTRYRQDERTCTIEALGEETCQVLFCEPQRAITPGQSVVFYQGDECLGGGVIDESFD
jgi:tRNA-specific 2-thiouridylase